MLLSEGNKSDAAKLLIKSWPKVVRTDILSEYVIWLMEEIVMRRKKWAQVILWAFKDKTPQMPLSSVCRSNP